VSSMEQTAPASIQSQPALSATVSVSIIIPALNEEKMIGRCLDSLAQLVFERERFEVILVDNGSCDRTIAIAESFKDRLSLRILQQTGVRISGLRNLGGRAAHGDILAFLDADCLPASDWLERIFALAPSDGIGVLGAHYLLPQKSTWVGRTWHVYQEAPKSGEVSHIPAGDLIIRREDFLRLGGFDESIQTNEDYELCERARAAGMKVCAFPEIGVVHLGTAQSLRVFFRKQAWHGTHVIKVFLRNVIKSHNRKAVFFAAYTFLCFAAALIGTVWAVGCHGSWLLPVVAVMALCLPPAALSARQVLASRRWLDFFPLFVLYLTYGIARAKALLGVKNFF
jgi:glycosyltransferase involved in cell wall biosynthesis